MDRSLKKDLYSFCFKSRCGKFYCFGSVWDTGHILFILFAILLFEIDFLCFVVVNFAFASISKNVFAAFQNSFFSASYELILCLKIYYVPTAFIF